MKTDRQKLAMVASHAAQYMSQNCDSYEITPMVISYLVNQFSEDEEMSSFIISESFDSLQSEVDKLT